MTSLTKLILLAGTAAAISIAALLHEIDDANGDNRDLRRSLQTETQARSTAEWMLENQDQTMQVFAAIRSANFAARQIDESRRNESKHKIITAVSHDACSNAPVPAVAVSELHKLEHYAHALPRYGSAN